MRSRWHRTRFGILTQTLVCLVSFSFPFSTGTSSWPTTSTCPPKNMFGAFRPTQPSFVGLLWYVLRQHHMSMFAHQVVPHRKTPWKLSRTRKANVRARLKQVDSVIEAVRASGVQCKALVCIPLVASIAVLRVHYRQDKALELPKEHEMPPRDKYTVFSRHTKGYRKGIHKVPKWTRVCIFRPIRDHLTHSHVIS